MPKIMDGATQFADLPLAPEDRTWDAGAARARMKKLCGGNGGPNGMGTMDWEKFAKGHLWVDSSAPDKMESYKLPIADVVDGRMAAVWGGVHAALQRLDATDIPTTDKASVKNHLKRYYKKFGKDFPEQDSADPIEDLKAELAGCEELDACETLADKAAKLLADGCEEARKVLHDANTKWDSLAQVGRVPLCDSFFAKPELIQAGDGKKMRVRVVFGQVDTKNANDRIYPKAEMLDAIAKANRLAKRGRLLGLDGHPGMPPFTRTVGARDIGIVWDKAMLKDIDCLAEGEVVASEAGKSYAACLDAGVELEWSKRGYGREEHHDIDDNIIEDAEVALHIDEGTYSHAVIRDYILRGVDIVTDGADATQTLSVTVDSAETEEPQTDDAITPPAVEDASEGAPMPEPTVVQDNKTPEPVTPPVPPAPPAPVVDVADIAAKVKAEIGDTKAEVADMAREAAKAVVAAQKLEDHKAKLLATVTDEAMRAPIEAHLDAATSIEDADARFSIFADALKARLTGEVPTGVGVITDQRHEKQYEDSWYLAGEIRPRPETAEGVRQALIDSIPSNGKPGRNDPRNVFAEMMDAMFEHSDTAHYFRAATRAGARRVIEDAATGTSALGTITPLIMPTLRDIYPKLVAYDGIVSVQPMNGPSATIHTLSFLTTPTQYNLNDSSNFDSTFADHTESATKAQIEPRIVPTTITARTKSLRYHFSQELRQDLRSVHNLDADQEMITAATDEIARELNYTLLDDLLNGATAGTATFGTRRPTGETNYAVQEWQNHLGMYVAQASSQIAEKTNRPADWVVCGPGAALGLKGMNAGGIRYEDRIEFGTGLSYLGALGGTIRVYEATWFSRLKMLFGFRPPTWSETGAVYAPYIPLYVSPEHYDAETNTYQRSVSWRGTWVITNGDCFSTITLQDADGTPLTNY